VVSPHVLGGAIATPLPFLDPPLTTVNGAFFTPVLVSTFLSVCCRQNLQPGAAPRMAGYAKDWEGVEQLIDIELF